MTRPTGRRASLTHLVAAVMVAAGLLVAPAAANAAPVPMAAAERGNDVSYPQCGAPLPSGHDFGIVGVDGGKPYDVNPCLAEQIVWARSAGRPAYYVNTANPGPRLSTHWPLGQTQPRTCTRSHPDSEACAFDYGWNAAKDSLARARAAAASVGAPDVTRSSWWLDVEVHNTWESLEYGHTATFLRNDTAVLRGAQRLLERRGVRRVGAYSTLHQWQRITGGASLGQAPVWYAGVGTQASARARCAPAYSFTGGPVRLTQFLRNGFDADLRC
jgi:hypothetical protein